MKALFAIFRQGRFLINMRAVVFSDSHGNYDVLEQIMERHKNDADILYEVIDEWMDEE
mgnify:CR=1 FL=1